MHPYPRKGSGRNGGGEARLVKKEANTTVCLPHRLAEKEWLELWLQRQVGIRLRRTQNLTVFLGNVQPLKVSKQWSYTATSLFER